MLRTRTHVALFSFIAVALLWAPYAHAWSFLTSRFNAPYNQCLTCHVSNSNYGLNPYGQDYMDPTQANTFHSIHGTSPGNCANCHSAAYPLVRSGLGTMDSDGDTFTNQAEFNAGTFPGDPADYPVDATAPVVTAFSLPATSDSLTVSVTHFTATDNVAVTGYLLTESSTVPSGGDAGWSATAPTFYTFATADIHTLYAWAKDGAGNVSSAISAQVDTTPSQQRVNAPPVAFAGDDQTVIEGETVSLDASGSTDDLAIIAYAWVQLDGPGGSPIAADDPLAVVLSSPDSATTSFVTPAVDTNGATLTFELTVTDGDGAQDVAEVYVTVDDNGISRFDGMQGVISTQSTNGDPIGIGVGGGACTALNMLTLQDMPAFSSQPQNLLYGLVDFELKVSAGNSSLASVTIYFPAPVPPEYKWYKYTDAKGWFDFDRDLISGGTGAGAVFSADRSQVTIYIEDNGEYDDNAAAGIISDPGGLASSTSASAVSVSPGSNSFGGSSGGCFVNTVSNHADVSWSVMLFTGALLLLAVIHKIFSREDNRK
jgi:hypothetical protein